MTFMCVYVACMPQASRNFYSLALLHLTLEACSMELQSQIGVEYADAAGNDGPGFALLMHPHVSYDWCTSVVLWSVVDPAVFEV